MKGRYLSDGADEARRGRLEARRQLLADMAAILARPEGARFMEWLLARCGLGKAPGLAPVELAQVAHELIRMAFECQGGAALTMLANLYANNLRK